MIVGSGLLSSEFKKFSESLENFLIFASGVSNSKETNINNFEREKKLLINLINNNQNLKLIYFSSVLTGIIDNDYYRHKLQVEEIIKNNCKNYIIFRIPQIVGFNGNKNNIVNFLKESVKNENEILIYKNVYRSLIDIEDLVNIVLYCIDKTNNSLLFLSGVEKISVMELSNKIYGLLHKNPKIKEETHLLNLNWDTENDILINQSIDFLQINREGYNDKILKKYIK